MPQTTSLLPNGHLFETMLENGDKLRASVSTFKGKQYIGIRCWYRGNDGEFYAGKNGINVMVGEASKLNAAMLALSSSLSLADR